MRSNILGNYLLIVSTFFAAGQGGFAEEVKRIDAAAHGDAIRVDVELSGPVDPVVRVLANPSRLVVDLPNVVFKKAANQLLVNKNGVSEISIRSSVGASHSTRLTVGIDAARPYSISTSGNNVELSILPHPEIVLTTRSAGSVTNATAGALRPEGTSKTAADTNGSDPQITHLPINTEIDESEGDSPVIARRSFNVKYIVGDTVYINGGANSGLRAGMDLAIVGSNHATQMDDRNQDQHGLVASVRVIGVAATSAITEVNKGGNEIRVGDTAELAPKDVGTALTNAQTASHGELARAWLPAGEITESSSAADKAGSSSLRSSEPPENAPEMRVTGRVGFDFSGISSYGSTPGTSTQRGVSVRSDMTHLFGTHWNLEGYWRGRLNRHSQFQEPTIEESLNKTYTMQLYYDNPQSKWAAGMGRLYLPWAVSLDTIDGGYLGRKLPLGVTAGVFAGSTPDLNSWNYQPNHRTGGSFINLQGGNYEKVHYSSTTGFALNSIGWKLDRPNLFFENEASYKGVLSIYHSLIADSALGASTKGMRLGPGISHSYFTAHLQPDRRMSFDLYHNYFRDVPTATTTIVGTGLVDKLLFQGISAGVHVRPTRDITLYTTLGESSKTGDLHRSLNQMYGASWSEIAHSGIRADFHYSKFKSNFGDGSYSAFSLSRQVTNRAFWNLQVGKQDLLSRYTNNYSSMYLADSVDINIGRRSYLQSGYTYVNGATLNYRQWYFSWGIRLDKGKSNPEYVQTLGPVH